VPSFFPEVSLKDPMFRHALDIAVVATFINFIIVGTAAYRGIAYMDTVSFCGASCHVMAPEHVAYRVSSHSNVACTDCHVAPTAAAYVHAKVDGTVQLLMVVAQNYPRPIMAVNKIPAASTTCVHCHSPGRFFGDKIVITNGYADDKSNTKTSSVTLMRDSRRAYGQN